METIPMPADAHVSVERLMKFMHEHLMLTEEEHTHLLRCPDCRRLLAHPNSPPAPENIPPEGRKKSG
jgi:hypothetical protein